ncbi:hypothetical protein BH10BAC2_BH10BAC2_37410 [soil metagenome]
MQKTDNTSSGKEMHLSIDLWNDTVLIQKLNYIHNHPVKEPRNLSSTPQVYKYSSVKFYETDIDDFDYAHISGNKTLVSDSLLVTTPTMAVEGDPLLASVSRSHP